MIIDLGDKHTLLWMLLLATLIWCAWWHTHENRQLSQRWKNALDNDSAQWLTRFAWSRTAQLLAALTICTGIIMAYDWQLSQQEKTIDDLNNKTKLAAAAPKATPERKPIPGNTALQPQAIAPTAQDNASYYPPPATAAQAAQIPQPANDDADASPDAETVNTQAPTRPEAAAHASGNTVQDVYNPETNDTGKTATLDAIKKRYEDILVTYFYLSKCGKANMQDNELILNALMQELVTNNAPGDMRNDIVSAAQGSYQEVYANSACNAATITPLYAQYNDYINSITATPPVR